ncbi:hypothetical protein Q604_UNBC02179G0001, partial [human gut metagenome]
MLPITEIIEPKKFVMRNEVIHCLY